MSQRKVLIVDDEPIVAEVCARVLAADGFDVEVAANGRLGKVKLDSRRYDVIIIDLLMPVLDGRGLFEYIKKSYPGMTERVILISGELINPETTGFVTSCGRPFLRKPFLPRELRALVRDVMNSNQD